MEITSRKIKHYCVIDLAGSVNDDDTPMIKEVFADLLAAGSVNFVIDMSGIQHFTSHVLGTIIGMWKKLTALKGSLDIILANQELESIVRSTNLHSVIKIFSSEEDFMVAAFEKAEGAIEVTLRDKGRYKIIDIKEPLNIIVGYHELDTLLAVLLEEGHKFLALNLSSVVHLYSEVVGVIIKWVKKAGNEGGKFVLVGIDEDLKKRLTFLDLDKILEFHVTESDLA